MSRAVISGGQRVLFPNMYMRLISANTKFPIGRAKFQVSPKMTKTEIKEYLTKIYKIPVIKVDTAILLGRWKRLYSKRRVISYKRRNVKEAFVQFTNSNPTVTTAVTPASSSSSSFAPKKTSSASSK